MDEALSKPAGAVRRWLLCQVCQKVVRLLVWTGPDKLRCEWCGEIVDLAQLEIEGKIYSDPTEELESKPDIPEEGQVTEPLCPQCGQPVYRWKSGVCWWCAKKLDELADRKEEKKARLAKHIKNWNARFNKNKKKAR